MEEKEKVTPEELDKYFSNVSYDFYNLPMAIIISFHKHKFAPMTFDELLNDITSKKDAINKLRKANRQKYSSLTIEINKILSERTELFQIAKKNKKINNQTYSIVLDEVINYWESQISTMSYINKSSVKKIKNNKKFFEDRIKREKENDDINSKNNELLSKKTKRKINRDENTPKKNVEKKNEKNEDGDGYKTSCKKAINNKNNNENNNVIKGYSTDFLSNANNMKNNEAVLMSLFDNYIYDKMPEIDEENLNTIIKKFGKIIEKLDKIRKKLKSLQTSKYVIQFFNEYKQLSENEKEKIVDKYKNIEGLLNKKKMNTDSLVKLNEELKQSVDYYLDVYGCSYESLFKILCEKNEILDYLLIDKEKEINNDVKDCFQKLYNFITANKKQIKESNNFLKVYTRNYYKARFDKILKKFAVDDPQNKKVIDLSQDCLESKNKSEKKVNNKKRSQSKSKDKNNKKIKNDFDFVIKKAMLEEQILSDGNSLKKGESTFLNNNIKKSEEKKIMNMEGKKDNNNNNKSNKKKCKNKSINGSTAHTNNTNNNSNNISNNNKDIKDINDTINTDTDKNSHNSEFIYAYEDLKGKKFKDKILSNCDEDSSFISYSELKSDGKKSICGEDNENEKDNDSRKSQTTATFFHNVNQKNKDKDKNK